MSTSLSWSSNIFSDLSQPDSILVLGYLCLAFLLGSLSVWWMKHKEIKNLKTVLKKNEADISFYKSKNGELAVQVDLLKAKANEAVPDHATITEGLKKEVADLKQAHLYLKKDYDVALKALHGAKEQAEEMQKTVMGSNILPQVSPSTDVNAARRKVKSYLQKKMDQQTTALSFKKELINKIGADRISPIDQMDENAIMALAALIPEQ